MVLFDRCRIYGIAGHLNVTRNIANTCHLLFGRMETPILRGRANVSWGAPGVVVSRSSYLPFDGRIAAREAKKRNRPLMCACAARTASRTLLFDR